MKTNLPHVPRRRWSQNFLRDENIARKIVGAVQLPPPQTIVEIGPGRGALTRHLVELYPQVLAVEVDPDLVGALPETLGHPGNLKIIQQDFLTIDLQHLSEQARHRPLIVIGNLPYHITSPILFRILDNAVLFRRAVFMIQKEVALRITASPNSKQYGILSVLTQYYAQTEYLFTVPASVFHPRPSVDSAVIRLDFPRPEGNKAADETLFRSIVRSTFNQRRKMMRNTLSKLISDTILERINFDFKKRPENLSVDEFVFLANQIHQLLTEKDDQSRNQ